MFNLKNLNSKILVSESMNIYFSCVKISRLWKLWPAAQNFLSGFVFQNLRSVTFPKLNWPWLVNYLAYFTNKIQQKNRERHRALVLETKSNKNPILGTSLSLSFGNNFHTRYRNLLFNGVVFNQLILSSKISLGNFPKMSWIRVYLRSWS